MASVSRNEPTQTLYSLSDEEEYSDCSSSSTPAQDSNKAFSERNGRTSTPSSICLQKRNAELLAKMIKKLHHYEWRNWDLSQRIASYEKQITACNLQLYLKNLELKHLGLQQYESDLSSRLLKIHLEKACSEVEQAKQEWAVMCQELSKVKDELAGMKRDLEQSKDETALANQALQDAEKSRDNLRFYMIAGAACILGLGFLHRRFFR